ncbi:hypothetical protein KEM48_003114 [Puccinia striiformis f. sp. tritici PST-130]|nr:hypothetical protein KEM48_003114 [Puccinia striiformis f. sp. tritici PST-130]
MINCMARVPRSRWCRYLAAYKKADFHILSSSEVQIQFLYLHHTSAPPTQKTQIYSHIIMNSAQSSPTASGAPTPDLDLVEIQLTFTPSTTDIGPNLPSYQLATNSLPSNYPLPPI